MWMAGLAKRRLGYVVLDWAGLGITCATQRTSNRKYKLNECVGTVGTSSFGWCDVDDRLTITCHSLTVSITASYGEE